MLRARGKKHAAQKAIVCLACFFSVNHGADAIIPVTSPHHAVSSHALQSRRTTLPITDLAVDKAEVMLLAVYRALGDGHLNDAQAKVDALAMAYPSFALGQLLRGDLLLMHSDSVADLGGGAGRNAAALAGLREEAIVRLGALTQRPEPGYVPKSIVKLRDNQKFAILVDASRSRLFLYKHQDGRLALVRDFYFSQGKQGAGKEREGDMKTPVGVYHVTDRMRQEQLTPFYGAAALPINYPNAWDTTQERTGHGIWLHGSPPESYSTAPKSTNGCVVLTNTDMAELASLVDIDTTPVIITEREDFVPAGEQEEARGIAIDLVEAWRKAASSAQPGRLADTYSKQFKLIDGVGQAEVIRTAAAWMKGGQWQPTELDAFTYPGQQNLLRVSFASPADGGATHGNRLLQYWQKEGNTWRIIAQHLESPGKA